MRHMVHHFPDKGFECPLCTLVCPSENCLKTHVSHHIDGKCPSVTKNFQKNSASALPSNGSLGKIVNDSESSSKSPAKAKGRAKTKGKATSPAQSKMSFKSSKRKSPVKNFNSNSSSSTITKYGSSYMNFYNNVSPNNSCTSTSQNIGKSVMEESDLYDPIDPIATTNKTLSYTDFYKKQPFMNTSRNNYSNTSNIAPSQTLDANSNNQLSVNYGNTTNSNNYINGDILNSTNLQSVSNSMTNVPVSKLSELSTQYNTMTGSKAMCPYPINGAHPPYQTAAAYSCQSEPLSLIVRDAVNSNMNSYPNTMAPSQTTNGSLPPASDDGHKSNNSEHITVKIDPYDVAPNMLGGNRTLHQPLQATQTHDQQHPLPIPRNTFNQQQQVCSYLRFNNNNNKRLLA